MPRIFRPEAVENFVAKGKARHEKWEQTLKTVAEKGDWVPIFGDIAKSVHSESGAVKAALWGVGEKGENLELDERVKLATKKHFQALKSKYVAVIKAGLLFVPEALLVKGVGKAVTGAKVVQKSAKLAKAAEKGVRVADKTRKFYRFSKGVREVKEGLSKLKEHKGKGASLVSSVALEHLSEHQSNPILRASFALGSKVTEAIGKLHPKEVAAAMKSVSDDKIAPDIHRLANAMV